MQASDKIIGGTSATPMGIPWQVLLSKLERNDKFVNWTNPIDWEWNISFTELFNPCNWPNPANPCNWFTNLTIPSIPDLLSMIPGFPAQPDYERYEATIEERVHVLCAGVLINADWVLTAASCTYK